MEAQSYSTIDDLLAWRGGEPVKLILIGGEIVQRPMSRFERRQVTATTLRPPPSSAWQGCRQRST